MNSDLHHVLAVPRVPTALACAIVSQLHMVLARAAGGAARATDAVLIIAETEDPPDALLDGVRQSQHRTRIRLTCWAALAGGVAAAVWYDRHGRRGGLRPRQAELIEAWYATLLVSA